VVAAARSTADGTAQSWQRAARRGVAKWRLQAPVLSQLELGMHARRGSLSGNSSEQLSPSQRPRAELVAGSGSSTGPRAPARAPVRRACG